MIPETVFLTAAGAAGFAALALSVILRRRGAGEARDIPVYITGLAAGTPGILLGMLLLDRRPCKENAMQKVFSLCLFVMQVLTVLYLHLEHRQPFSPAFWQPLTSCVWLSAVLAALNLTAFILFGTDKARARRDGRRIPIVVLLGLCFFGGAVGGLVGMYAFRHKTRKNYFFIGLPLMLLMHLCALLFAVNVAV